MTLTEEHIRIASEIDVRIRKLERNGNTETEILTKMFNHMPNLDSYISIKQPVKKAFPLLI